jgi:hypothetical protein
VSWKVIKNLKKLDFYTSTKSINRIGYVMKGKMELLTNFKKQFIPKVEFQSLCNFSFLKIVKIEPPNKDQSFFSKRDSYSARKTSLSISFTSLIGME